MVPASERAGFIFGGLLIAAGVGFASITATHHAVFRDCLAAGLLGVLIASVTAFVHASQWWHEHHRRASEPHTKGQLVNMDSRPAYAITDDEGSEHNVDEGPMPPDGVVYIKNSNNRRYNATINIKDDPQPPPAPSAPHGPR